MNIETAQRLYEFRKANGYSQEELALKIGVSRQAISKWERSESSPDTDNLISLANLYGVTINELLNGTSIPKSPEEKNENKQNAYSNGAGSRKEKVSFKNGIHVDDGNDKVDISRRGIHIESKNGDSVHISPSGDNHINIKGEQVKNPWLHALLPLCAVVFYLAVGFYTDRGWACGWIIFLFIPIIESTFFAIKAKNPSYFCYPVLATAVFLICGMVFGIWHPTWIVFLTIPAYYALCDAYKKSRQGNDDTDAAKNYYTPNSIDSNAPLKKSNTATVITSVLCAILILAVTGIIGISAFR